MKYKAKKVVSGPQAGLWAVHTGSRYWDSTATSNKLKAEQTAGIMSLQWHQDQIEKIWSAICDSADGNYEPMLEGYDSPTSLGDLLC